MWSTPPQRKHSVEAFLQHKDSQALPHAPSVESSRLLRGFDCALPYGHVFIYAWSFSVLRHDVPRFLLAQKRREETKDDLDVFIASKMRPTFGWLQAIWVSGSFKRKEKKAQIKILGTPPLPNFKILGGALPQGQDLIGACSL